MSRILFMAIEQEIILRSCCPRLESPVNSFTYIVLCVPLNELGVNSSPLERVIKNCSSFLFDQLKLIKPNLMVTLGKSALMALHKINKHNMKLPKRGEMPVTCKWNSFNVLPLYYPSQKVMNMFRNKEQQMADYRLILEWL